MSAGNEFNEQMPLTGNNGGIGTVRLCYVTSPRELMTEGVGYDGRITPTLVALMNAIKEGKTSVRRIEIAAVFADDDGCEFRKASDGRETAAPSRTFSWLQRFCEANGIAFHVEPSKGWRSLKKGTAEKEEGKRRYESMMLSFMRENRIDVILSDSYTILFNSVMLNHQNGYGRLILNIHPGIASEVPGLTPTHDAFVKSRYFAHSAKEIGRIPGSEYIRVNRNGYDESIMRIFGKLGITPLMDEKYVYVPAGVRDIARAATGATLHEVDELIDHGPTVHFSSGTPIRKGDHEHDLRIRNYATKNKAVVNGLSNFLSRKAPEQRIAENRSRMMQMAIAR